MEIYSLIMFAVAALVTAVGLAVYRGKTDLIHDYHQDNVSEDNRKSYGKAFGKALFVLGASLIASGLAALLSDSAMIPVVILLIGIAVTGIMIISVQKKYNGGIF